MAGLFFVVLDLTYDPSDVNDILHTLLVFGFFRFYWFYYYFLFSRGSRIQKSVKRIFDENRNTQPLIVVQDTLG